MLLMQSTEEDCYSCLHQQELMACAVWRAVREESLILHVQELYETATYSDRPDVVLTEV